MGKIIVDDTIYVSVEKLVKVLKVTNGFGPQKIDAIIRIIDNMELPTKENDSEKSGIVVDISILPDKGSNIINNVTNFVSDTANTVQTKAKTFYNDEDVKKSAGDIKDGVVVFAKATVSAFKTKKVYGPVESPTEK